MHVPVTVRFPDYAFNKKYLYVMLSWDVFLIYLFLWHAQKLRNKSLLNLEKKRNSCLRDFLLNLLCCLRDQLCWKMICLRACLQERDHAGLIDKPEQGGSF